MTRPSVLVLALAIAAPTLAAPVAAAPTPAPEPYGAAIEFRLGANNGLHAEVEAEPDGEVTLEISRRGRLVQYQVHGESTEEGLKAQFGKLGLIDLAFRATETRTAKLPDRCEGPPTTWSKGVFYGTIQFAGERNFVRIDARRAIGSLDVYRTLAWECRRRGPGARPVRGGNRSAFASAQSETEEPPAALGVVDRACGCSFAAFGIRYPNGRGRSIFYGTRVEEREGMEIARATYAHAGASAFDFDLGAGTARVDPPSPFSGKGAFRRRPGRDLWRSTIRVPILGADPVEIRGRRARARLGVFHSR